MQSDPKSPGFLASAAIVVLCAAAAAIGGELTAAAPSERRVHVDSFRYGKEPAVIRANRGDRLTLSFSTRDTAHSFFLEEFDVHARVNPGSHGVEVGSVAHPEKGAERRETVTIDTGPAGFFGRFASRFAYRCHVWCGPLHAFEQGALVLWPNPLFAASLGALLGIVIVAALRARRGAPPAPAAGTDLLRRFPPLARAVKTRGLPFAFVAAGTVFLWIVVLTSLLGTQMSGRNLGVMLLWVVWLFLLVAVLTPLFGRAWCLACPLPLLGETLQRRTLTGVRVKDVSGGAGPSANNRLAGLSRPWPRALSGPALRTVVFLGLATFSVVLVAKPSATGLALLALVAAAAILAVVFPRRAFCRFVCPIAVFVSLYGSLGKLALRRRDAKTCADCTGKWCLAGGTRGWGCPYDLCVERIEDNAECGLCTECLKTCPHDNVGLFWRPFGAESGVRSTSESVVAAAMLVTAIAYCLVYLGPWPALRDLVNVLDKANWAGLALYAAVLWGSALVLAPAVLLGAAALGRATSGGAVSTAGAFRSAGTALVPLGLFTWIAFAVPMLAVNRTFIIQSLSDPFGWGWDFFGTSGAPWRQLFPTAVPWLQAAAILAGAAFALRAGWRAIRREAAGGTAAGRAFLPSALLVVSTAAGLLHFFTD